MSEKKFRMHVLESFGASAEVAEELYSYNENRFQQIPDSEIGMRDEPFIDAWDEYLKESIEKGVFECLKEKLVQFNFPIRKGISSTENYKSATRKGDPIAEMEDATGLVLVCPEKLQFVLHQSPAGRIPLIITGHRDDFVSILRSICKKNEPEPIPDTTGAMIIGGYNNWDRVRRYRKQWEMQKTDSNSAIAWKEEFSNLIPQKKLYQDRFIILSDGPYSGLSSVDMGMEEQEWKDTSLIIRQEHECTHYVTKRLFSSMQNNLYDELLADYMGIVTAAGRFRADWFLRFMGLEGFPDVQMVGRFSDYRGDPPLSDDAFEILKRLVISAAKNLERIDNTLSAKMGALFDKNKMLITLTSFSLEDLVSNETDTRLIKSFEND